MLYLFSFLRRRVRTGPALVRMRALVLSTLFWLPLSPVHASDIGYRDFNYGSADTPTADKPQSKLWWNDGWWWAGLWNPTVAAYRIYRLEPSTQTWVDTGTTIDNRADSHLDTLWDGAHLVIVAGSLTKDARLYRFSYAPSTRTYTRDSGFPVTVRSGGSESISVTRDSTGRLWVTFTQGERLKVNCSTGDDRFWLGAFIPTVAGNRMEGDDISGIIAMPNGRVGVLWSNQAAKKFYFSVHLDIDPPMLWMPSEVALPGPGQNTSYPWADDHINIKTYGGKVYAAVKTSLDALSDSNLPLTMLLIRDALGNWTNIPFGRVADEHTRPIVVIDEDHATLSMFATTPVSGGAIFMKSTPLNNLHFAMGFGTPILRSSTDTAINNATASKQNAASGSGLVILAADSHTHRYLHNVVGAGGVPPPPPPSGDTTLTTTADAYVRDGSSAATNYGTAHDLFAKTSSSAGYNRDTYVKFDTRSLSGTVSNATLRIWASLTASGGVGTAIYPVADTSWTETGITWNNRPARGAALASATVSGTGSTWYTLDVTAYVRSERTAGRGVVAFAIHNPSSSDQVVRINSREAGNGPQLVITVQ